MSETAYTIVIGLEVHVQLKTQPSCSVAAARIRRPSQHADLSRLYRHAGQSAGDEPQGLSDWH